MRGDSEGDAFDVMFRGYGGGGSLNLGYHFGDQRGLWYFGVYTGFPVLSCWETTIFWLEPKFSYSQKDVPLSEAT